jgi:hypothetical protein
LRADIWALPGNLVEALALKHPKALAGKTQAQAFALEARGFEGHPPQGSAGAATDPPAQFEAPRGLTFLGVVHTNRLNRIGADLVEILGCPSGQVAQVEAGHPFLLLVRAGRSLQARLIAVVEHLVHFHCSRIEP